MAKVGDIVRFLNTTGGGRITRIEGRVAYVDDDGFETPVLINELVVVSEASSQVAKTVALEDAAKARAASASPASATSTSAAPAPAPRFFEPEPGQPLKVTETEYGDKLSVVIGYEPHDIKQLSTTEFDAYLVNDSNYFLMLTYLTSTDGRHWNVASSLEIEPNTQVLVDEITRQRLSEMTYVAVQFIAFKKGAPFERKLPVWFEQKLDMTKFFKLHCFRPNMYFDGPVIAVEIMTDDKPAAAPKVDASVIKESMQGKREADRPAVRPVKRRREQGAADGPLVVDLHIDQLLDTTAGMSTADILNYQIDTFRKVMDANLRNHGKKIIFIHGKGEGVLRNALMKEMNYRYKTHTAQDASFREYGYGATQITIR